MSASPWLRPGARRDSLPSIPSRPHRSPRWAPPDPIDELTERLRDFRGQAAFSTWLTTSIEPW